MMGRNARDRVRLNVGGKIFETSAATLNNAGRESMLGALFDNSWNLGLMPARARSKDHFIDRNAQCFAVLLDLLRTGELHVPPNVPEKLLFREASFYGLLDHVRTARWGRPLDGNRLHLTGSVPGLAPRGGTAIRAGPNGGFCVANGSMVHVYDWMLEEHRPISLDFQKVNDVGYLDAGSIVVTARERLGKGEGGIGVFSSLTGELRHRLRVKHDGKVKSFTAGALSFGGGSDDKIFASCKGRSKEYGIGVWDAVTGEQSDFFYEPPGCSLGNASKLQWIPGDKCLMVATLFPKTHDCFVRLLDFREKSVVWSWSDAGGHAMAVMPFQDDMIVLDAISIEDGRSICVANQYEDLGFIDLRGGGVRWNYRRKFLSPKVPNVEDCKAKLETHNGQLFSSMNDTISVFCGPGRLLTSTLRSSGSICDFSIGGDRLFALHSEENVFDVWETPASPIM